MTLRRSAPFAAFALLAWVMGAVSPLQAEDVEGLILPFRDVKLSSTTEAKLYEVIAAEGDQVAEDAVLAILYSNLELLERDRQEKIMIQAKREWDANQRLSDKKIVSEEKTLISQLEYEVAKIDFERVKANIEEKTLRAPWAGQIVRRFSEEGETVPRAKEIYQLVDYSKLYVVVYLESKHINHIKEGDHAKVAIPMLEIPPVDGTVSFVDPVIDGGSGLFRVKLLLENPGHAIKPGLRAIASFNFGDS